MLDILWKEIVKCPGREGVEEPEVKKAETLYRGKYHLDEGTGCT